MKGVVFFFSVSTVLAGKIVFHEDVEESRNERRYSGLDLFPWMNSLNSTMSPDYINIPEETTTEIVSNFTTTEEPIALVHGDNSSNICSGGASWCSHPIGYPKEAILKAVRNQKDSMLKIILPTQRIPSEKQGLRLDPGIPVDEAVLGLRSGFSEIEEDFPILNEEEDGFENICGLTTEYIMPRAAKNKEGQFRFLVNHPEGGGEQYIQLVRVGKCHGEGEACGWGVITERETKCQQEYLDHKLVALSENGEQLVVDTFRFPSCCNCLVNNRDYF